MFVCTINCLSSFLTSFNLWSLSSKKYSLESFSLIKLKRKIAHKVVSRKASGRSFYSRTMRPCIIYKEFYTLNSYQRCQIDELS